MGGSLRDQLLKKGLVTKKQAKAAAREVREQAKAARKQQKQGAVPDEVDSIAREAAEALKQKAERDRERNRQHEAARLHKELMAQVRDLILKHQVRYRKGPITHNFVHGTRVKTLHVTEEMHQQIAWGDLAITVLDDQYYLAPPDVARKVIERLPEAVLVLNEPPEPADPDDPYAVPDDLMW